MAVTLALSYVAYSAVRPPAPATPVYSVSTYSLYGSPSFLVVTLNASRPSAAPAQLMLDGASSSSGILTESARSFAWTDSLCTPSGYTFFSVNSSAGPLTVQSGSRVWIDGVAGAAANVPAGLNEVVIGPSAACSVTLPGGGEATFPSGSVSSVPFERLTAASFVAYVPYAAGGHALSLVTEGGVESVGF